MNHLLKITIICCLLAVIVAGCAGLRGPDAAARPAQPSVGAGGGVAALAPAVTVPTTPEPEPVPGSVLAHLSTEEQLLQATIPRRDPYGLAVRLDPDLAALPAAVAEPNGYQVGDREIFWVHNADTERNLELEAELVYKTDVVNVWVESGRSYDHERLISSIDRFSRMSYPKLTAIFGREWSPGVDGDVRLHVLHNAQMGSSVAGYYYSADEYSRLVNPFSNEKEIFFINLNFVNGLHDYTVYETVLAHEFQHMIHWNQDRGEDLWLNEGLSEFAQEVADYAPDTIFVFAFGSYPDLQLTTWSPVPGANSPHYGAAYLFVAYLAQRFGPQFLGTLVAEQANGTEGVTAALQAAGFDVDFDSLFADWVVANWADEPQALGEDGRYGYWMIDLPAFTPADQLSRFPVDETAAEVSNYGTDYIQFLGEGDITFHFAGDTETVLAPTNAVSGRRMWWSNRGDDANPRLTREFDLSALPAGIQVTMTVQSWWDIEQNYDYGYVMASRDGQGWAILAGDRTRTDNPTGNALGAGYTGRSMAGGAAPVWVTEQYDLSAYTGGPLWIQFSYVTDDGVNAAGWFIDDVAIPALGLLDDFEGDVDAWQSEAWILTDNRLPQRWIVQLLEFEVGHLTAVRRVPVDDQGRATLDVDGLGKGRTAVIAISALAPATTEPAKYRYWVTNR
ncbi:MAG: immune inhibitor A [Caldilineaceae bacterium]|nr:immune inhibitor A [Caldilineaceae bacterium]